MPEIASIKSLTPQAANDILGVISGSRSKFPVRLDDPTQVQGDTICEIDVSPVASRYELGKRVVDAMGSDAALRALSDRLIWPAFTVAFRDQLFYDESGEFKPGSSDRHVISEDKHKQTGKIPHRHLVRSAVEMVARHGEDSRFILCNLPNKPSGAEEQFVSRSGLEHAFLASTTTVRAFNLMFAKQNGRLKQFAKQGAANMAVELCYKSRYHFIPMMEPIDVVRLLSDRNFSNAKAAAERAHKRQRKSESEAVAHRKEMMAA